MTLVSVIIPHSNALYVSGRHSRVLVLRHIPAVEIVVINNGGKSVDDIIARYRQTHKHP